MMKQNQRKEQRERRPARPAEEVAAGASAAAMEAEQQFLARALLDGQLRQEAIGRNLRRSAFVHWGHAAVWEALVALQAGELGQRDEVDLLILADRLTAAGSLEAAGGLHGLHQLANAAETSAGGGYWLSRVCEYWVRRTAGGILGEAAQDLAEPGDGSAERLRDLAARLAGMADFVDPAAPAAKTVEAAILRTSLAIEGKLDRSRCLAWGLERVQRKLGALDVAEEDWFIVLAAAPGMGKSTWARWMTVANLREGRRVAVFLLETSKRKWAELAAGQMARVDMRGLELCRRERQEKLAAAFAELRDWETSGRLAFYEDVFAVEDVEMRVRALDRKWREGDIGAGVEPAKARGLDLVVVDYLQLLSMRHDRPRKREEEVAQISRRLKLLFKAVHTTGLVAAQLNREGRSPNHPPTQAALRESGAIEQDADRILFLWMPPQTRAGGEQTKDAIEVEVDLIQEKNRNGPVGTVGVLWQKPTGTYADLAVRSRAEPGEPKPEDFG